MRLARVGSRLKAGLADWIEARGTRQEQTTQPDRPMRDQAAPQDGPAPGPVWLTGLKD